MPSFLLLTARRMTAHTGGRQALKTMATIAKTQAQRDMGATMPPDHKAKVGNLETFELPDVVTGSGSDKAIGDALIKAWKRDGIFQIAMKPSQRKIYKEAEQHSQRFFGMSHNEKAACVDSQSYAGYIASGEEITDGVADYSGTVNPSPQPHSTPRVGLKLSYCTCVLWANILVTFFPLSQLKIVDLADSMRTEIFTVTKDLPLSDPRVQNKWPCHGPCPWLDTPMNSVMTKYMDYLGESGDKLLALTELGLNVPRGSLARYVQDGWHHMRILRLVWSLLTTCIPFWFVPMSETLQIPGKQQDKWKGKGRSWHRQSH